MSVKIRWLVPIADLFGRRGGVAAFLEARVVSSSSTRVRSQQGIKHQASGRTSHNELFSTFVIFIVSYNATFLFLKLRRSTHSYRKISRVGNMAEF